MQKILAWIKAWTVDAVKPGKGPEEAGRLKNWLAKQDLITRTRFNGQILLPGIAEPYRWDFAENRRRV